MSAVNVARSADEAERQARGEDVTAKAMTEAEEDAEAAKSAAAALFEDGASSEEGEANPRAPRPSRRQAA